MSRQALELALEALKKARRKILTTEECHAVIMSIKEALAQAEQEPVKMIEYICVCGKGMRFESKDGIVAPQRKPLKDEDIAELAERMEASDPTDSFWREFARAIEAAHGIKE